MPTSDTIPQITPPDMIRTADVGLIVTITYQGSSAIYLRAFEEYLHRSFILRKGPIPAAKRPTMRVRSAQDLHFAE